MRRALNPIVLVLMGFLMGFLMGCSEASDAAADAQETPDQALSDSALPLDVPSPTELALGDVPSADLPLGDPVYQVGTNDAGQSDPAQFAAATQGSSLPAVVGSQGSWMVVVAAATNQFEAGVERVDVVASLSSPDSSIEYGRLSLVKRPVFDGLGGMKYLMNVFLVLPADDTQWSGKAAVLHVELKPTGGEKVLSQDVSVTLQRE